MKRQQATASTEYTSKAGLQQQQGAYSRRSVPATAGGL